MMMGFGLFGLLFMLLFWGVLIALAVWIAGTLFPAANRPMGSANQDRTARQIIDLRYARGELTREQYDLMKRDIS